MKYLIILGLFAFVLALLLWRLRPYIQMARRVLGFVRDVRRVQTATKPSSTASTRQSMDASARLVRCDACGTWTPAERALTLRHSRSTYCSHTCLERSAEGTRQRPLNRKQG